MNDEVKSASGLSKEGMVKRYHESVAEMAEIKKKLEPVQRKWQALRDRINAIEEEMAPVAEEMVKIRGPLYELQQEQTMITRALGASTLSTNGSPPNDAGAAAADTKGKAAKK